MDIENNDYECRAFARLLKTLPEHLPISNHYEEVDPQKQGRWWHSQREHMVSWFEAQTTTGTGAYSRKVPNQSAKKTYNRLSSAEGILWINEALGVDNSQIQAAANAALAEPNRRSRCKIIRQFLPWNLVFEKTLERKN